MLIRLLSALAQNGEVLNAGETINLVTHQAQDLVAKGHAEIILLQSIVKKQETDIPTSETDIPTSGVGREPVVAEIPADVQPQTIPLGRTGGKKGQ